MPGIQAKFGVHELPGRRNGIENEHLVGLASLIFECDLAAAKYWSYLCLGASVPYLILHPPMFSPYHPCIKLTALS
jgi:hypothetical protein